MTPHLAAKWIWIAFGAFWLVAAFVQKRTARRQSAKSHLLQVSILWIAFAPLFIAGRRFHLLQRHVFATPAAVQWTGVLLMAIGCGFAMWARVVLGGNWSGTVTVKENHALITHGPYGWVRHPIYTGVLLLLCGTAIMMGTLSTLVEVAAVILALSLKLRTEESLMTETFGEQYISYRRRVKALIPFVI
jgi:protein-S-isoprenylcysteine O-methyltransferase Ste14